MAAVGEKAVSPTPIEHAVEISFPIFPSVEGFQELALHRLRSGPGCIVIVTAQSRLLIRDALCPACLGPPRTARDG